MSTNPISTRRIVFGLDTQIVGVNITYQESMPSTQDEAHSVEDDDPEGMVFITDEQTEGRGRDGRTWVAPPGAGLLLSVYLRPDATTYAKLGMVASLAAAEAIAAVTGLPTTIKWPNDLLVNGRKVGGVLVEGHFFGEVPHHAAVGVGINVNWDTIDIPEAPYVPTSLSRELGEPVDRNALAIALLNHLDRLYLAAQRGAPIHDAWRARLSTLGQRVHLAGSGPERDALAVDVTPDGGLVVQDAAGGQETVYAADVTLSHS